MSGPLHPVVEIVAAFSVRDAEGCYTLQPEFAEAVRAALEPLPPAEAKTATRDLMRFASVLHNKGAAVASADLVKVVSRCVSEREERQRAEAVDGAEAIRAGAAAFRRKTEAVRPGLISLSDPGKAVRLNAFARVTVRC